LRRVIENLCTNAVKYGLADTPITITLKAEAERVQLSVHNYGPVIPKEQQSRLFEAFQRAPSAEQSGKRGWGLGLTLVRGITEAHGGSVEVASSEKEGTTFTVSLPWDTRR
jgi:signal transduction histidine kinase